MLKLFKSTFKTTNDCIIVVTPLIIFLSLIGCYFDYAIDAIDTANKLLFSIITIIIMTSGCFSGWFYMVKKAIDLSKRIIVVDKDRMKELAKLFLSLLKGIGRLFLPIAFIGTFSAIILCCTYFVIRHVGLGLNLAAVLGFTVLILYIFFTMLWIAEIVYGDRNPLKALLNTVLNIKKSPKDTFLIFLYSIFIISAITILNKFLMTNPFLYFFVLIFFYYFFVYIVVLLFTYYEQEFKA